MFGSSKLTAALLALAIAGPVAATRADALFLKKALKSAKKTAEGAGKIAVDASKAVANVATSLSNKTVAQAKKLKDNPALQKLAASPIGQAAIRFASEQVDKALAAAKELKGLAKDAWEQATDAIEKGISDLGKLAGDVWSKLGSGLGDKLLDVASDAIVFLVKPLCKTASAGVVPADRAFASSSRREAPAACGATELGSWIGTAMRAAMTGLVSVKGGMLAWSWKLVKDPTDFMAMASNQKYLKSVSKAREVLGVEKNWMEASAWKDAVKSNAKSAVKGGLVSMALTAAEQFVTFQVSWLVAHIDCFGKWKTGTEAEYKACFAEKFEIYTRRWLFDSFVGMAIASLDGVIAPLVMNLAVTVSAAVAAASAGVGLALAPLVGALVGLVTKIGISVGLGYLAEFIFWKEFKNGNLWKQAWNGMFKDFAASASNSFYYTRKQLGKDVVSLWETATLQK